MVGDVAVKVKKRIMVPVGEEVEVWRLIRQDEKKNKQTVNHKTKHRYRK